MSVASFVHDGQCVARERLQVRLVLTTSVLQLAGMIGQVRVIVYNPGGSIAWCFKGQGIRFSLSRDRYILCLFIMALFGVLFYEKS